MENLSKCNAELQSGVLVQRKKKFQQFSLIEICCLGPISSFSKPLFFCHKYT